MSYTWLSSGLGFPKTPESKDLSANLVHLGPGPGELSQKLGLVFPKGLDRSLEEGLIIGYALVEVPGKGGKGVHLLQCQGGLGLFKPFPKVLDIDIEFLDEHIGTVRPFDQVRFPIDMPHHFL